MAIQTKLPSFTYTGSYETQLRSDWGWIIRFKSNGTLMFTDRDHKIDVFLVGGGAGGENAWHGSGYGRGGCGGYTATHMNISVKKGQGYYISIGAGDGSSNYQTRGGASTGFGLSSGSTGGGASDGGAGDYEFGMTGWRRFAGGGGDGGPAYSAGNNGGDGGGGRGGNGAHYNGASQNGHSGDNGVENTGGGGGGGGETYSGDRTNWGGNGGSGIVCIRNNAADGLPVVYDGTWLERLFFNGTDVQSLIFSGQQIFARVWKEVTGWLYGLTMQSSAAKA